MIGVQWKYYSCYCNLMMKLKMNFHVLCLISLLFFQLPLFLLCSPLETEGMALLKFKERVVRDPLNALFNWRSKDGLTDHCSWFGVHCSDDGYVVILNLKDLCLGGTLARELGQLSYIKSIILRNNSFDGIIPSEIACLEELEVLDLGYNNFSGSLPTNLGNNFSLSILLLDNNKLLDSLSPELSELQLLSEQQVDEKQLRGASAGIGCSSEPVSWYTSQPKDFIRRILLKKKPLSKPSEGNTKRGSTISSSHLPSPPHFRHSRSHASESPASAPTHSHSRVPSHSHSHSQTPTNPHASLSPASAQATQVPKSSVSSKTRDGSSSKNNKLIIWVPIAGSVAVLIIAAAAVLICRCSKVVTVKPWATGLSGQLQSAFVSGVPKLKRPELDIACEEFSNIIGSLADGTVYKGTLSSGIEIAVIASSIKSPEEWTETLELEFRKKIETLSKVNHKNFVNLIGYCEDEKPFTRMMVFEYAPNGTLFEHLHIKEAERLDWKMRVRILMGMAYCLEHMHQLNPAIPHRDLQSCAIYLSEDYAAKISDFSFWNEGSTCTMRSSSMRLLEASSTDIESNVFNFAMVLLEMITGRIPYMEDDWVLELLGKDHLPAQAVDPTLTSFPDEQAQSLFHIVRDCVNADAGERPTMRQVVARLREITGISPDGATPKLSPLWWAELEILSMGSN